MKYKCGMYGGSFNPMHQGHVQCIITAANLCERLIIVISSGCNRDEVDVRIRYRWIYQITKHLPDVNIMILEDDCESKEAYDEKQWFIDAQKVKDFAKEPIDVIFCGDDYGEDSFWNKCYPEAELVILPRNGISSTEIRRNVYDRWEWLPMIVRPYYVKKVLIIGCESTGKSTLAQNLALHFNTNYMEEVGRDISAWLDSTSTVFSIVANALMVLRYREQWILWIIVNFVTVIMWGRSGDAIMTTMWAVYLINAIYGYVNWSRMSKSNVKNEEPNVIT